MASFGKRALETDSYSHEGNGVEPNTNNSTNSNTSKRSCLKRSPAASVLDEHSPASGEHSPASGEPSPATSDTSVEEDYSHLEYKDKLIVDLTGDSDEDEQDVSIPPAPTVIIKDNYTSSEMIDSQLLRHLGMKRFLVDHDYILCPYCLITDQGKRKKPMETRVSKIIENFIARSDKRYMKMLEVMQEIDNILNVNSSIYNELEILAGHFVDMRFELKTKDKHVGNFICELESVLQLLTMRKDKECSYRTLFYLFLDIVSSGLPQVCFTQKPSVETSTVSFPTWNQSTTISGKPDIVIQKQGGGHKTTLGIVECKRYKEMKFMFEKAEIKGDHDLEKMLPHVRFCKTAKKPGKSDKVANKDIIKTMYRDLDPTICRRLKCDEKTYFSSFIGQLVGEVLAWFNTSDQIPVIIPFEIARDKCMKYAVGQLGFKIIFVTVGINNSCKENPPHIRIGERTGMALDVFITRPFDLLKVDDRGKIRDILFVMMASSWRRDVALNE